MYLTLCYNVLHAVSSFSPTKALVASVTSFIRFVAANLLPLDGQSCHIILLFVNHVITLVLCLPLPYQTNLSVYIVLFTQRDLGTAWHVFFSLKHVFALCRPLHHHHPPLMLPLQLQMSRRMRSVLFFMQTLMVLTLVFVLMLNVLLPFHFVSICPMMVMCHLFNAHSVGIFLRRRTRYVIRVVKVGFRVAASVVLFLLRLCLDIGLLAPIFRASLTFIFLTSLSQQEVFGSQQNVPTVPINLSLNSLSVAFADTMSLSVFAKAMLS